MSQKTIDALCRRNSENRAFQENVRLHNERFSRWAIVCYGANRAISVVPVDVARKVMAILDLEWAPIWLGQDSAIVKKSK